MNAYKDAMRRYATFSGRSSRSQFWLYTLVLFVLLIIGATLDTIFGTTDGQDLFIIAGLINIVHLIPSLAVFVRRLHDSDKSGWWVLLGFVPLIGQIVLLIFACLPSSPGTNRFGQGQHPDLPAAAPYGAPTARHEGLPPRSVADRLAQLGELRANGTIDDDEFKRLKAEVMQQG